MGFCRTSKCPYRYVGRVPKGLEYDANTLRPSPLPETICESSLNFHSESDNQYVIDPQTIFDIRVQ